VLAVFAVIGGAWVRFVMKKGLFEPSPIDAEGAPGSHP
jgi:hypothetical protein